MRVSLIRTAHLIGVLLGVSFLVYLLLDLMPGDTAEVIGGQLENSSPAVIEQIRQSMGLDRPFAVRYLEWLGNALQGDLGSSYRTGQSVVSAVLDRMPVTFQLLLMVEVLSLAIAIPLATLAASKRDTWIDKLIATITFGLQSMPNFMVAVLLVFYLAVNLGILPAIGYVSPGEDLLGSIRSLVIPTLALSASIIPIYIRVLRTEMVRTLQEDFILLARSVGLRPSTIMARYALKSSLPTLVTVVGINIGMLIGGSIVVEQISGLPGIGSLLFNSIKSQDYVLVQGVILMIATAYVVTNFAIDMLYTWLDPRVRV
ncbi:ABC transporter permease [Aeromicrobium wangtongii]|uniref:ABC transporter permease n=1 Tax=Aeromicrobium wangtongii TaxID=2969247 RepID=UPI002017C6AF|nr:ABC transporter permease [Aeromicrobium wangtongii]MCL3819399.1 ABC transporter permease [Aeromicrobium wangtongii]